MKKVLIACAVVAALVVAFFAGMYVQSARSSSDVLEEVACVNTTACNVAKKTYMANIMSVEEVKRICFCGGGKQNVSPKTTTKKRRPMIDPEACERAKKKYQMRMMSKQRYEEICGIR